MFKSALHFFVMACDTKIKRRAAEESLFKSGQACIVESSRKADGQTLDRLSRGVGYLSLDTRDSNVI